MREPAWYVVQVETGREQKACDDILRVCRQAEQRRALEADEDLDANAHPLLHECFAPQFRTQFKLHGEWHDEERMLLPGYVIAVTDNPWELARTTRAAPGFERIVRQGETFAPLSDEDRGWIKQWTSEGDRTIPMSIAYKAGDRVVVTDGPLKGQEALIKKIKRRQNLAELEIHAGAITIRATVGLAVLPEPPEGSMTPSEG